LKIKEIILKCVLTFLLLIVLESLTAVLSGASSSVNLKINFSLLFCLFFILRLNLKVASYMILFTQLIHCVFSLDHWAIETIAGVLLLIVFKAVESFFQVTSKIYLFFYSLILTLCWNLLTGVLIYFKSLDSDVIFFTIVNSYIPILVQSFLFIFLSKRMDLIWIAQEDKRGV